ncbi:hypothetical protein [Salinispira pacifica]|uniref:Uncharacterized protein n=1 Tax=Salinispira pacifica TaxID=1307761 RepID=V5WFK4_9SPIO|nr:hypothetical protein [Salinispira pacifica]AHC14553.1 hypothetical protein L21SP2_1150 [Salinispira pacifica]
MFVPAERRDSRARAQAMMRWILFLTALFAIFLFNSFRWPENAEVVTEFASTGSPLASGRPAPFLALSSPGGYSRSSDSPVLFQGNLPNGLGFIQAYADAQGYVEVFGNLNGKALQPDSGDLPTMGMNSWSELSKPLIYLILDHRRHQVVNPELFMPNPAGNAPPSLRRMIFRTPESVNEEEQNGIELWSWYRRADIPHGEYILSLDTADGRFEWNDVGRLFSVRLYVNGQLQYIQGNSYFVEDEGGIRLFPGESGDFRSIPISLRPGKNIIEVYLEDAKGLSQAYEFTIDGGAPGAQ